FAAALLKLGNDTHAPVAARVGAVAAVPGGLPRVEPPLFDFLRARLTQDEPVVQRTLAADTLARAKLSSEQLGQLTESFKNAGPMELSRLLDAFGQSTDVKVGQDLVAGLGVAPARGGLRPETLKPLLTKY